MKKNNQYVPTTLDGYLNESKSFMLKRGYGSRKPVIVGAKGTVRDQVLPFVAENRKVSGKVLRKFIAGLNEQGSKPAAVNMWLKRNSKYFIAESRNGTTFFTLSKIGKRLVNRMRPILEQKGDHDFIDKKKGYDRPGITSSANEDELTDEACDEALVAEAEGAGKEIKTNTIEKYLAGKKKKMYKKSEWANLLEGEDEEELEDEDVSEMEKEDEDDDKEKLEESARKKRIAKLLEEIRDKRDAEKLNEEDEEDEDELTFDDIDLGDDEEEGEESEEGEETSDDGEVDNIEIAEFILTVDDADAALAELEERGITAEIVTDEDEGEEEESDDFDLEAEDEEEAGDDLFGEEGGEESEEAEDTDLDLGLEEADDTDEEVEDSGFDLGDEGEEDTIEGEDEEEVEDIDLGDEGEGEEGEEEEGQKIRVSAEHAEELVKYLEEKGVDVEEMFGGELDIEGSGDDEDGAEGEEPAEDVEDAEDVDSEEDAGGEEEENFEL